MAYEIKSFRTWVSYYDVAQDLSASDQGKYWRAIMDYMFAGIDREAELPKMARLAFKSVKANLKRSKSKARSGETCEDDAEYTLCTSHENETKNALNLKLNLNSNSKPNADVAAAGSKRPAPPAGMPDAARVPCPKCGADVEARRSGSVYSVRCECGADLAVPWTYVSNGGWSS